MIIPCPSLYFLITIGKPTQYVLLNIVKSHADNCLHGVVLYKQSISKKRLQIQKKKKKKSTASQETLKCSELGNKKTIQISIGPA